TGGGFSRNCVPDLTDLTDLTDGKRWNNFPITNFPITNYPLPITNSLFNCDTDRDRPLLSITQ
ncbi:hypothetical protein ON021_13450, partial [Microcoleus sp. HI-ES]|nr:hypothetical protein [Microcoleus sp. HI-ES]